jgi:hypothetical protein
MPEYRAYLLDESDKISSAAIFIQEETDDAAIQAAKQYVDGYDIELWQDDRRVTRIKSEE